jgi:hypothetical protein
MRFTIFWAAQNRAPLNSLSRFTSVAAAACPSRFLISTPRMKRGLTRTDVRVKIRYIHRAPAFGPGARANRNLFQLVLWTAKHWFAAL